jgi:hypothetical protein
LDNPPESNELHVLLGKYPEGFHQVFQSHGMKKLKIKYDQTNTKEKKNKNKCCKSINNNM